MHPYVQLARKSIEEFVRNRRIIAPPSPLPEYMEKRAGVFVCIKKMGELRGCVGTIAPSRKNIAEEIIENAIATATRDGRFEPLEESELDHISVTVDVLSDPAAVDCVDDLDPKKHGLIVTCGFRRGLLLPDIEGVDTVEEQMIICRRKAGIMPDEPVTLECFTVERYA